MMAMPARYAEFLMISTNTDEPLTSDYYVGPFSSFERVSENGLPKEIDTFLFGDQTKEPFTSRFKFKKR